MTVTVTPATFTMVDFDAARIEQLVLELLPVVGLTIDTELGVHVIEDVPLARAEVVSVTPARIEVEGGALEDPRRPRQFFEAGAADILGRLLLRVRDRLDPAFGDPPPDHELPLTYVAAWDTYCVARLARAGYRAQRQRRLYIFRNRHGFTDAADAAFDRLWSTPVLRWPDIVALSDSAQPADHPIPA